VGKLESERAVSNARETRRLFGFVATRFDQIRFERVPDPRDPRGKRWALSTLLFASLLGIMTGQKSFADVERFTEQLPRSVRYRFGIRRRIPDTTLRNALGTIELQTLRPILHSTMRSAIRSKSISVDFELPFGIVSMDGKYVTVPTVDDRYSQRSTHGDSETAIRGRIGTMTATLSSSLARPCIDVYPVPAATNEMGVFARALDAFLDAYGNLDLFRLVTYDAGICSKANAQHIRDRHLHYLLGLKGSQPDLLFWASLWLNQRAPESADALSVDGKGKYEVRRTLFLASCPCGTDGWDHLRTVVHVDSDGFDRHGKPTHETFYFLSSLSPDRLSPQQWLTVIRRHWAVETTHQILDDAFDEDQRPWVTQNPRLTAVIMILRRIGYTLLTIFKHVTERSESRQSEPWHVLLSRIRDAMLLATDTIVAAARRRSAEPLPTLL
jgi:hypothetical protein